MHSDPLDYGLNNFVYPVPRCYEHLSNRARRLAAKMRHDRFQGVMHQGKSKGIDEEILSFVIGTGKFEVGWVIGNYTGETIAKQG